MDGILSQGISIDKIWINKSDFKQGHQKDQALQSHRDEGHIFHILETGTVEIEIDFLTYIISAPSVVYMHPSQVHRLLNFENVTVNSLAISNENINPDYLNHLEELAPLKPIQMSEGKFLVVLNLISLGLNFSNQRNSKLHFSLLKDSCNTLIAYLISNVLHQNNPDTNHSRYELIAKSFKHTLEENYFKLKRPNEYAEKLNISTAYLNECIKNTTGFPVSQHIQNRVILEAKRLLHHTNKSVKEIAFELGYVDYPYFTRLFAKASGMSALKFRNKNPD